MRKNNSQKVQIYGDIICYETLECESGMLCLDWREICDGIQHCLEGKDEENCDLLEMNECDEAEEYRCENGMCIPQEFFLDGDLDCLDWSDEMPFKDSSECTRESVNIECDDHLCPPNLWSCGDGQCISDRLGFQRLSTTTTCASGRNEYFLCETRVSNPQWTMSNGRCFLGDRYESLTMLNRNNEEQCEYLLKCTLSRGSEMHCSCYDDPRCARQLARECRLPLIRYPRRSMVTPFTFFLFNRTRNWLNRQPDFVEINGTVRCRAMLVTVREKIIPFDKNWSERQMIEEHFCQPLVSNISSSSMFSTGQPCHHENESTEVCEAWNPCLSRTRIRDGEKNCLNGRDEEEPSEMEMEKNCARVRRHRFRCSNDEPSCLSVIRLGDGFGHCRNRFDELFFGVGRTISSIACDYQRQDQCSLLRQYIEQSSKSTMKKNVQERSELPFRSHCDTFSDLPGREDENLRECEQWWICPHDQHRCPTGQCLEQSWINDLEWDCPDASDEHTSLISITGEMLGRALEYDFANRSFFVPSSCPEQPHSYLCLSSNATEQGFACFNLSQIGDGNIDCAGGQDERNTLRNCSHSSPSILGSSFLCPSTNTCIPYYLHCWKDEHRCPNRSDDELWCDRQRRPLNCFDVNDFVCFGGRCAKGARCNENFECPFWEDEYMCDYSSSFNRVLVPYRERKRFSPRRRLTILHFALYPLDVNITQLEFSSPLIIVPLPSSITSLSNSSPPYWCNRGLGILSTRNHSTILCFCPPQYYGDKCEYHADRLSVVLHADLSQLTQIDRDDPTILLKLLVLFLFNDDQVLMFDQFHLHPSVKFDSFLNKKKSKLITHFLYPRSPTFLLNRRERFFNRSPFSIRIELYQTRINQSPSMLAVWKYPLDFAHLPVSRLSKVLRFNRSPLDQLNPCSSQPCGRNERCHQLMNNRSQFICLCTTNFTGENCSEVDQQCLQGYCNSKDSLCQPNSRLSRRENSSPFCLCSLNRYGQRCEIEYDVCLSHPCLNNGSCFPDSQLDRLICLCRKEYFGSRCEMKRSSFYFALSTELLHRGVVLQVLRIDLSSLELTLLQQQAFLTIPHLMEYYHQDQSQITGLVLAKVYSSAEASFSDVHLLSVYQSIVSIQGRTNISSINRCEHRRTFSSSSSEDSSPIRYHQICVDDSTRLCFRDEFYLCICADNHSRVECFLYDDQLDRCELCRANGRCLQGSPGQLNDFVCLCPECHAGRQCQFSTKSFFFTLDQLFSPDLLSADRQRSISLLIFFPLFGLFLSIPSNLFSFLTLRRRSCLRHGVGHYLLAMSVTNPLSLALLTARLIHLTVIIAISRSSPLIDDLFCKLLSYLSTSLSRLSPWLSSFVALERVYSVLFFNRHWFKQPSVARCLMCWIVALILLSTLDELLFVKSFISIDNENRATCVVEYPFTHQSVWISIHQFVSVSHFLFPLLINLCSMLTIMGIVIRNKMNIRVTKHCKFLVCFAEDNFKLTFVICL